MYTLALSSDNALGVAATVSASDQLLILFWKKTADGALGTPGAFFPGQARTSGLGGTHPRGFKTGNGNSSTPGFASCDLFCSVLFTLTGQDWNATPGGGGTGINGDVTLLQNAAPTAAFNNVSTNQAAPTQITRGVAASLGNASADVTTNRLYSYNGQACFEATSAAHDPGDLTPTDGSRFEFSNGLAYGFPFGTVLPGDMGGVSYATYTGPSFRDHTHTFPNIDLYRVVFTVRDDSEPSLTATVNGYLRTVYRSPTLALLARQWMSWDNYKLAPAATNPGFSASNANTINDVARVGVTLSEPDSFIGKNAAMRLGAPVTISGSSVTLSKAGIGAGLPSSAPYGFVTFVTQASQLIRHTYRLMGATANSITIDPAGANQTYGANDWLFTAAEPAGGTDARWTWEVQEGSGAWQQLGSTGTGALANGVTVSKVGIGERALPGWSFAVLDGPSRGTYAVVSVPHDNAIVLDTSISLAADDAWTLGCDNGPALWPQRLNQALNFRATLSYTNGWTDQLATTTQSGSVNNLAPDAQVDRTVITGAAATYQFNAGRSTGTITVWFGAGAFVNPITLDGTSACTFSDPAIDTTQLRDGHAWLGITQPTGELLMVFAIADLDRETPDPHRITIDTQGVAATLQAGATFKLTNAYEIEGGNQDNDVVSYAWQLRSAAAAQTLPTTHAEFVARFDRADGTGAGVEWGYTYSDVDNGRFGCIELTVVDARGAATTTWAAFPIVVGLPPVGSGARTRLEWD